MMIVTIESARKPIEAGKIVNVMKADDNVDIELLALAKSRRSSKNREFTSVDEFITFLEK